jgi:hypothetical protein
MKAIYEYVRHTPLVEGANGLWCAAAGAAPEYFMWLAL